jgi:hypothetical protein
MMQPCSGPTAGACFETGKTDPTRAPGVDTCVAGAGIDP